jgi:hypothetical protein
MGWGAFSALQPIRVLCRKRLFVIRARGLQVQQSVIL